MKQYKNQNRSQQNPQSCVPLKLALEREKAATKTMERKLYLKRLAEKNQQIRHVVQFKNFFFFS
jgi:hypothetical protein